LIPGRGLIAGKEELSNRLVLREAIVSNGLFSEENSRVVQRNLWFSPVHLVYL
jgi:hypothetical protein